MSTIRNNTSPTAATQDIQQAKDCVKLSVGVVTGAAKGHVAWNPESDAFLVRKDNTPGENALGIALYVPNIAIGAVIGAASMVAAGVWAAKAGVDALLSR